MNRRTILALASGFVPVAGFARRAMPAQPVGTPVRLRGTIDDLAADRLQVMLRDQSETSVTVPQGVRITWPLQAQPRDIQQGSYIGTAAIPLPDGSLKALEVQVFPPSMRGVGERTRPWDTGVGSSMTNGTVGSVVEANGRMITIMYKGGGKRVFVPDNVPIVTYEPADRVALTPGAHVLINGTRAVDGTITAISIAVGKNGLVPPM
jgi:hypothetical protein